MLIAEVFLVRERVLQAFSCLVQVSGLGRDDHQKYWRFVGVWFPIGSIRMIFL